MAAREKGNSGNIGSFEDVDSDGDLDLVGQSPMADLLGTDMILIELASVTIRPTWEGQKGQKTPGIQPRFRYAW